MALDRWIAFVILLISLVYGYTAYFTMDDGLPPFMRFNPVWPSTFPKILAALGVLFSLAILLGFEKQSPDAAEKKPEIDYHRLMDYKVGQAALMLAIMVAYAFLLRPAGFLISTTAFLIVGSVILGERKFHIMIPVAVIAAGTVWYLVQQVLGIYLLPWPEFIGVGG